MALQIPVATEKRSRLSTLQPPLWATWSLSAATESEWKSRNEKANERLAGVLNKLSKNPRPPKKDSHWSKFSIKSMLQDGSDNAIHASDWKTYHEEETAEPERELGAGQTGHIDQDRIGSISLEVSKLQPLMTSVLEEPAEAIGTITTEMLEPGYFDYTPLLPIEQDQVERFLRLTGYKPEQPHNQRSEHEVFRESYRQSLTSTSKECSQLEEENDPLEISKKFQLLQRKLTFNRVNEDVQGRQAFINMCKVAMPTRHTDWLLQKVYEDSLKDVKESAVSTELGNQIKGVNEYKESISTLQAIEMVKSGSMPFEKAAIVMHVLASASNLRTKDIVLSKQYITEAVVGSRKRKENLNRCRTESAALARTMKVLFPHFFQKQQDGTTNSSQIESSIQAALDNINTINAREIGNRKEKPIDVDPPTLPEASTSDNPFIIPREQMRTPEEEARLRWEFKQRQARLTQKLYDDLELQSEEEDEEYESGDSNWAELDEDDVPLDGILDLQDWVESCHTKASYKQLKEHVSEVYDGQIPAWVEERLDPQYKMRFKVATQEDVELTNVEKEKRRRKEILKGLPDKLHRRTQSSLSGAYRKAEVIDKKEQKEGLMKRFEEEKAIKKAARQARLERRNRDRQQAEIERKNFEAMQKAKKERLDCERAINDARFNKPTRLKDETESDAERRLQKALEERADKEIAYLEKNQAEIQEFKNNLRSLEPSKRLKKRGVKLTNAQKEKRRKRINERYNLERQKWLTSLRHGSGQA